MKRTLVATALGAAAVTAGATAASSTLTLAANPLTVAYGKTTVLTHEGKKGRTDAPRGEVARYS